MKPTGIFPDLGILKILPTNPKICFRFFEITIIKTTMSGVYQALIDRLSKINDNIDAGEDVGT